MKRFLSMRLLGVMAIAAIALSNVILSACSEDDDLEMNSSTLAKGLMTRAGEGSGNLQPALASEYFVQGDTTVETLLGRTDYKIQVHVSWISEYVRDQRVQVEYSFPTTDGESVEIFPQTISAKFMVGCIQIVYCAGDEYGDGIVTVPVNPSTPPVDSSNDDTYADDNQQDSNDVPQIIHTYIYTDENGERMVSIVYSNNSVKNMTYERYCELNNLQH